MKHQIITFLLTLLMSVVGAKALAYDAKINGIYYNLYGTTAEVTYCYYNSSLYLYTGSIDIPASVTYNGTTYSVTSIGSSAFLNCSSLTNVTIPNSVTYIGDYAFEGCSSLMSVDIPNSVTSIGYYAFRYCSSLTSVSIPNSVTRVGTNPFSGCSELTSIYVSSGNTKYDSRNNCKAIIEISSNTLISGCKNTVVPNTVKEIGGAAFYGCSGLTSLTIPNSVASIGSSAFYGCSGLTSVNIPNSVTSIDNSTFYGCSGLTDVNIPNSVTSIGNSAFSGCSSLTNVIIPNSVTSMGSDTFSGCSSLLSVTIGNSVNGIGSNVFKSCSSLTSVAIPNSVKIIGSAAFNGCSSLTNVVIPNSVTSIGNDAFRDCSSLLSVSIGNSVTSIGSDAFRGCSNLTRIQVSLGNTKYDSRNNCNALIETTSNKLILGCSNSIIPNSVTSIGSYAFYGCSGLVNVTIPNSVTRIWDYAFYGCLGLTSVTIGNSVTSIGNYAFWQCSSLTSVTVGMETPLSIDYYTFTNKANATLYVPYGCKDAYKEANYWKGFKEIVEMPKPVEATDITQLDNIIYMEDTEVRCGAQATLSLRMKNSAPIRGFQFDLYLPEGVTVAKSSKGRILGQLSPGRLPDEDEHELTFSERSDGAIRFLCGTQYDEVFTGNEGEIATLTVNIAETLLDGDYPIQLKNMVLNETDISRFYETDLVQSKLNITSYLPGDISGDGIVNVLDYTGVANHIHGATPTGFVVKAADVDENGVVDVRDYTGVANIIHTGNITGAAASRANKAKKNTDMKEPQ